MKKTTKLLIAAFAAVSVVGVGAVSYAAWTAGSASSSVSVSGSTGSILTIGNLTVTPAEGCGSTAADGAITMTSLCPIDQPDIGSEFVAYWEFTVTKAGTAQQTVTVKGEFNGEGGTPKGGAKLFYTATAPSKDDNNIYQPVVGAADISADTSVKITFAENAASATVYVYMTATGTDAMSNTIKLMFEANAATA